MPEYTYSNVVYVLGLYYSIRYEYCYLGTSLSVLCMSNVMAYY